MLSDDSVAVEVPVKPSQSPSTSYKKPRRTPSIVHHNLLLNNCVLLSVDVKTGGDGGGILQIQKKPHLILWLPHQAESLVDHYPGAS